MNSVDNFYRTLKKMNCQMSIPSIFVKTYTPKVSILHVLKFILITNQCTTRRHQYTRATLKP